MGYILRVQSNNSPYYKVAFQRKEDPVRAEPNTLLHIVQLLVKINPVQMAQEVLEGGTNFSRDKFLWIDVDHCGSGLVLREIMSPCCHLDRDSNKLRAAIRGRVHPAPEP